MYGGTPSERSWPSTSGPGMYPPVEPPSAKRAGAAGSARSTRRALIGAENYYPGTAPSPLSEAVSRWVEDARVYLPQLPRIPQELLEERDYASVPLANPLAATWITREPMGSGNDGGAKGLRQQHRLIVDRNFLVLLAVMALSLCGMLVAGVKVLFFRGSSAPAETPDWLTPWELVLDEHFDGPELDPSLWEVERNCWGGGNNEKQCYRDDPANVYVSDGKLVLRAQRGDYTGSASDCTMLPAESAESAEGCAATKPFTSGRVRTLKSPAGSWRYGRFEVRARLPRGDFLWPAIWMQPTDEVYGHWAASGEIDIMEFRGQVPGELNAALHYWDRFPQDKWVGSNKSFAPKIQDFSQDFHDFALEWEADPYTRRPKEMRWFVDGEEFYHADLTNSFFPPGGNLRHPQGAPWDQRFYLTLNVAVGGQYFSSTGFGDIHEANLDQVAASWAKDTMEIDHVRVWAQRGFEDSPSAAS